MPTENKNLTLAEAANSYLSSLKPEDSGTSQQEVYKFVRWFGRNRSFNGLTASEVDNFAENLSRSDTDYLRKLGLIRAFLAYAKKKGWIKTNLATHLKARKGKAKQVSTSAEIKTEAVSFTQQGYADMKTELAALQEERLQAIDEIRKAAADKDFRENAPLDAARERRGWIEGRINELESLLRTAIIIDEQRKVSLKVAIGDTVVLNELNSEDEIRYTLVSPKEVDVVKGKISGASPVGKAVIGKEQGETVEITAPVGKIVYKIQRIEH